MKKDVQIFSLLKMVTHFTGLPDEKRCITCYQFEIGLTFTLPVYRMKKDAQIEKFFIDARQIFIKVLEDPLGAGDHTRFARLDEKMTQI